jgi:hypothetical protein
MDRSAKNPIRERRNPEQEIRRKELEMRKRKTKQTRTSVSDKGHKKRDPKCPKNNQTKKVAAQLHMARDIIQEDDEEGDQEVIQPVEEDGDGNSEEEEEDPYYGSQYTSEGEEVEINDLEHQEWSDQECAEERMHMMRTQERQEMKIFDKNMSSDREFPLLVEVDNEEGMEEIEEITLNKEAFCYKFSLSNHASSSCIVLLIADVLRHPQLVLVIADSSLTRPLTYSFLAC